MRIAHISDTHGRFFEPKGYYDAVVHSGDILPDPPPEVFLTGSPEKYQFEWLSERVEDFRLYYGRKPFFYTPGNHDWINSFSMEELLQSNGINAHCLQDKIVSVNNVNFYGFPYIPPINGRFAYETVLDDMVQRVDEMVSKINNTYVDVIVAHCPPAGCLDLEFSQRQRFGNGPMATALDFKINPDMMPGYYLTGHIHGSKGVAMRNGMLVSNAATTSQIIEI